MHLRKKHRVDVSHVPENDLAGWGWGDSTESSVPWFLSLRTYHVVAHCWSHLNKNTIFKPPHSKAEAQKWKPHHLRPGVQSTLRWEWVRQAASRPQALWESGRAQDQLNRMTVTREQESTSIIYYGRIVPWTRNKAQEDDLKAKFLNI